MKSYQQKGSALIYAVILLASVGTIALAIAQMSLSSTQRFAQEVDGIQTQFLAESATELAFTVRNLYKTSLPFALIPVCSEEAISGGDCSEPCEAPDTDCKNVCVWGEKSKVVYQSEISDSDFLFHDLSFSKKSDPDLDTIKPPTKLLTLRVYRPKKSGDPISVAPDDQTAFKDRIFIIQTIGKYGQASTTLNAATGLPAQASEIVNISGLAQFIPKFLTETFLRDYYSADSSC